ncbi:MFS transporter [Aquabacterium sp.]|uniref:MFS transporter n=1 Tax=Aquabacterium sp. TaxID=1872578 RepID=UPI002D05DE4E|nr:MFS transporter [Aquabacterium sp.]HSW08114.1 MFS transporter [Aquabacterium sp.]
MTLTATPPAVPFFGAWVVRGAFVLAAFGWGVGFYGLPVFLQAVVQRTGWPLTLVSAAMTLHFLAGALVITRLPRWHARVGVPATLVCGSVLTMAGLLGWALAWLPWQLFAAALLSGMGWVTMGAVAVNAVIAPWFVRTRPLALSRAYNGASIGGVLFSPLWVALIAGFGFAGAVAAVGLVTVVLMTALGRWVFAHTPQGLGQQPDGEVAAPSAREAAVADHAALPGARLWRDRAFQSLAFGMAAGLFAQIGLLAHLFSLLAPGLGAQHAGLVMGGATACAIAGRSAATRLLPRVGDRRIVAAAGYAVQALGSLLMLMADGVATGTMLLGIVLFGSGLGNATSLPPLIAQSDFARQDTARVVALVVAIAQASYAFAPALFGVLLSASAAAGQASGSPRSTALFFIVAAGVQALAGAALLAGRRRGRR